jgi:hypothetical protein
VVNGFSGYAPAFYLPLTLGFARGDPTILDSLTRRMPLVMVIDNQAPGSERVRRMVDEHPGSKLLGVERGRSVYQLPHILSYPPPAGGKPLKVARLTGNLSFEDSSALEDRDWTTRWHTVEPQRGTEFVMVELQEEQTVSNVMLTLGPFIHDYPRELVIETSLDGAVWTEAWSGPCSGLVYEAALEHPRESPMVFRLEPHRARFVRLRQVAFDETYFWSIAELSVLGEIGSGFPATRRGRGQPPRRER